MWSAAAIKGHTALSSRGSNLPDSVILTPREGRRQRTPPRYLAPATSERAARVLTALPTAFVGCFQGDGVLCPLL